MRRMNQYDIHHEHTPLSDFELDAMVHEIIHLFPNCGEKTVSGRLKSSGIFIQRDRIREAIQRVDPLGIRERCRRVLHRRKYQVSSPNALWHLDGYQTHSMALRHSWWYRRFQQIDHIFEGCNQ